MDGQIMKVNISELFPHPHNEKIYGENEDITELKEKIRKNGMVTTLTITKDNVILSGNRRWKVCKELTQEGDNRFHTVNCEVRNFGNEEDELEYLVICNDTREKTIEQKAREAQTLIEIEKQRAEKRRLATLKQNSSTDRAEPPTRTEDDSIGRPRDIVAKKLKMKSGREVERVVKSVETIDKLTETGRKDDAELIRDTLNNNSASTAADLSSHIDELTKEEKQAIRDKQISAYKVVSKYATKRTPKATDDMSEEQQAELAHKQACKEAVEEYIAQSMGLIDTSESSPDDRTDDLIAFFNSSVNTVTTAIGNLIGKSSDFSEVQISEIFDIVNNAEYIVNQFCFAIIKQSMNRKSKIRNISDNQITESSLEERAKRLKDDSESHLTYSMITGMFESETNNYLDSLDSYIEMTNDVKEDNSDIDALIAQLATVQYSISQKIINLRKIITENMEVITK